MNHEELLKEGFTENQIVEIEAGREKSVDISVYADKKFQFIQMREIRIGLEHRIDARKYADTAYDWLQMEQIRVGLENSVDISIYANPSIESTKMREIRLGLEQGMNLSQFLNRSADIIREIRNAKNDGVNISKYVDAGYNAEQLTEIRIALKKKINLDGYLLPEYAAPAIAQIRDGIEIGVRVKEYAHLEYSWLQMREIRLGMENRIDTAIYTSPYFTWEQMREIRLGLEEGLDVSDYGRLRFPANEMKRRHALLRKAMHLDPEDEAPETAEEAAERVIAKSLSDEELKEKLNETDELILESERLRQSRAITLSIDANAMSVYISIPVKRDVKREEIDKLFEESNIKAGIKEDKIEEILSGRYSPGQQVLVASGKLAKRGADGYYEFFIGGEKKNTPTVNDDGSVDYKNVQWFETVDESQLLAYYHDAEDGEDGFNVYGEILVAARGIEQKMLTGKGFSLDEDRHTYRATEKGMVSLDGTHMDVTKHLAVDDVTTKNLEFDGSVEINGNVDNGVKIKATGDIVINGSVGVAVIESTEGSVMLKKGMNAGGKGYVKAAKNVNSKFFESVDVVAGGDIKANVFLHADVRAKGKVESTVTLVGGSTMASKGFILHSVGNKAGVKTYIRLDLDEHLKAQQIRSRELKTKIQSEVTTLKNAMIEMQEKYPPEVRNTMDIYLKVENAIYTKEKQLTEIIKTDGELQAKVLEQESAKVIIKGDVFEGTYVDINRLRWLGRGQYNITLKKNGSQISCVNNV